MESDNPFNEKKAANGTNTPPGNNSDDSGGSKETSLTSTSWEEEYSLSDMKENFPRAFSPLHRSLVQNSYDADRSSNTEHALANLECQLARLTLQFHSLAQSYNDSVARLRQAEHENELLRKQNLELQASNMEFVKLIARKDSYVGHTSSSINNDLSPASPVYSFPDTTSSLLSLESLYTDFPRQKSNAFISQLANDSDKSLTGFRPRPEKFAAGSSGVDAKGAAAVACRTKVNNNRQSVLPKSISIRSNGYLSLKTNQLSKKPPPLMPKPLPVIPPQRPHRLRLTAATDPLAGAHACTEAENLDVEYDVYNQGMFKTELCNKWQDTGSCPYGERCQFAHGLEELRPVIRHPRYKTELCRMVAAGEKCPYGHRCHFRHCLSREEKLAISSSSNDAAPVRSLP